MWDGVPQPNFAIIPGRSPYHEFSWRVVPTSFTGFSPTVPARLQRDVFSENPGNEVEVVLEMTNFGEIIERGKKSSWCVYVLFLTSLEEFHYKVVQWRQKNALKSVMHVQVRCKELFKPFFTVRIAVAVMISWLPIISLIVNHLCIVEFLHCWLVR